MTLALGGALAAGAAAVSEVLLRPYRAIVANPPGEEAPATSTADNLLAAVGVAPADVLLADAVVSESHSDELQITDHPVEQGAVISDHAFRQPAQLTVVYGWAAGSLRAIQQNGGFPSDGQLDPDMLRGIYGRIRKLQSERTLCAVYTGKRAYSNMLIRSCSLETTKETEHALIVRLVLREVLIARTQVVDVPDDSVQADPEANATGNVISSGPQQLGPAPNFVPFDSP